MPELQKIPENNIFYRRWVADVTRTVFLLVHSLGAHSERCKFLAKYSLKKSISSYAIELKGFGEGCVFVPLVGEYGW